MTNNFYGTFKVFSNYKQRKEVVSLTATWAYTNRQAFLYKSLVKDDVIKV